MDPGEKVLRTAPTWHRQGYSSQRNSQRSQEQAVCPKFRRI